MKNWDLKKLGEVCEFVGGSQPPKSYFSYEEKKGYIRLIQIRDYKSDKNIVYIPIEKAKRFCDSNDIMIGRYGPPVFQILKGLEGSYNVALMKAVPNEKVISKEYLFLFLKFSKIQDYIINLSHRAVGQTGVNKEAIEDYSILIPPLPEQKKIVDILEKVFISILKAKNNAEHNLKNSKELFESYLQSTFINNIEGIKNATLESLCELIVDCEHKTAPIQETGYPSIRTPNIGKGELILDKVNRVSHDSYLKWTRRAIPQAEDLILAREAPAGNIAIIPENIEVCLGQRTVLLRTTKNKIMPKYMLYFLLSKKVQERLLSHSIGATVQHINMKDIRAFKIYNLPDIEEQKIIVKKLDNLFVEIKKLETLYQKKINDLDELKKSILQKAFSGELKSKEEIPVL